MDNSINYEQLAQAVKEKKESSPEFQQAEHREIISQVLHEQRTAIQPTAHNPQLTTNNQRPTTNDSLASYAGEAPQDAKRQVEELIRHTFEHGLRAGITEAVKTDPFVLDLYHDTLTEKLYEEMKNKKLL